MIDEKKKTSDLVNADMHVHIDRHINREDIIKILRLAENNGVKKMSLIQHNKIDQFLPNSPLMQLIEEDGGLARFFTGELVPSVEMDTIIDCATVTPNGKDYNNRSAHIQLFFNVGDAEKLTQLTWWNSKIQSKIADDDFIKFSEAGRKLGLNMPSREFCDAQKDHFIKGLFAWMHHCPEIQEEYRRKLGLNDTQMSNPSAFLRYIFNGPGDLMYYKTDAYPTLTQLVQVANTFGGKLVINHPAHMDPKFSLQEYLSILKSIPPVIDGKPNFYGIEGLYNSNTPEENAEIFAFANDFGLKLSAGSDFRLNADGKMFVLDRNTGESFLYDAKPGLALNAFHHKDQSSELLTQADFMSVYAICGGVQKVK